MKLNFYIFFVLISISFTGSAQDVIYWSGSSANGNWDWGNGCTMCIYYKEKANSNELTIPNLVSSQQTVLVKVSLQNGQTVTKKIIF